MEASSPFFALAAAALSFSIYSNSSALGSCLTIGGSGPLKSTFTGAMSLI
jgi:hypothetical protein